MAYEDRYVIRLRGLPWSATDEEIINFLQCEIAGGEKGIQRTFTKEGRPSGEAYVELCSEDDVKKTLDKDRSMMGRRYIEIFESSAKEMEYVISRSGGNHPEPKTNDSAMIRMRGLPYQCTTDEIAQFFQGLEIVPNGISLPLDDSGRNTGEAFVEFASHLGAEGALHKHKEKIGHRYIEIFKSTLRELNSAVGESERPYDSGRGRPGPYDRPRGGGGSRGMRGSRFGGRGGRRNNGRGYGGGGDFYDDEEYDDYDDGDYYDDGGYGNRGGGGRYRGRGRGGGIKGYGGSSRGGGYGSGSRGRYSNYGNGGYDDYYEDDDGMTSQHVIHLRGLPFKATDYDISNFFSPIVPVRIHREYGRDGRVSGEADVEFASYQDVHAAMQKDGESMMHRYIELFQRGPGSKAGGRGGRRRGGRGGGYRY